jgi:hypothetical protein
VIPVTGVFANSTDAVRARDSLKSHGIPEDSVNLLMPERKRSASKRVAVTDAEQPGIGKVLGGVVGGVVGAAAGVEVGALGAAFLLPGVGTIIAVGAAAAALLGTGGAIGGAVVGEALDEALSEGLPVDELFLYRDATRKGRSVVIAFAANHKQADTTLQLLREQGAESIDAAGDSWSLGIRDDQEVKFRDSSERSEAEQQDFRWGFEAALNPMYRGKPYDDVKDALKVEAPDRFETEPFKRGYERGQRYVTPDQQNR